ncbi:MAG: pyridoxal phosphate-dependent aminotransferase, partial [Rhodothermales bacterium]|nr:pyridoxal phosphate-dependent aminotransferase [Rhodothermales bacterium]
GPQGHRGTARSAPLSAPPATPDREPGGIAMDMWRYYEITHAAHTVMNPSSGERLDELGRVLNLMERHDLYAITDEIYEYMLYDGREHVSLASLPGAYPRTITLSGFSKTYNMTGWRLGYAVAPPPVIDKMGLLNDLIYICAPAPLQYGMADALPLDPSYFEQMQTAYAAKRQLMCETLERIGFDVPWPQGAYYVLAGFGPLRERLGGFADARTASETLVRQAGVATVPGPSFFGNPADGEDRLRFCFAKEMPVLEQACRQLVEAFGEVPA